MGTLSLFFTVNNLVPFVLASQPRLPSPQSPRQTQCFVAGPASAFSRSVPAEDRLMGRETAHESFSRKCRRLL